MKKLFLFLVPLNIFAQVGPTGIGQVNGGYPGVISAASSGISGNQATNTVTSWTSNSIFLARQALAGINPTNIVYVDTNGNDSTAVIGDPTRPYLQLGTAISNQPVNGAVVASPGQVFTVTNQIVFSLTKTYTLVMNGSVATGLFLVSDGTTNNSKLFSFGGSIKMYGGSLNEAYFWTPGTQNALVPCSFQINATNQTYEFHGTFFQGWNDVFLQGGVGTNCQLYLLDGCGTASMGDQIKTPMGRTNDCFGVFQNGTITMTNYPGGSTSGSPCILGSNSRWLFQNVTLNLIDTTTGATPTVWGAAGAGCIAYIDNCHINYGGTNATYQIVNCANNSSFYLYGATILTNASSGGIVNGSGGCQIVTNGFNLPWFYAPNGVTNSSFFAGATFTAQQVNVPTNSWLPVFPTNSPFSTNQMWMAVSNSGSTNCAMWFGCWDAASNMVIRGHVP